MFDVSFGLRRQLNQVTSSDTTHINDIRWEDQETKHIVYLTLSAMLCLHVPLILITNLIVILTFYYCKTLRTPDNHVLAGLAVSDFLSGVTGIPILLISNFDEAHFLRTKELCFLRRTILVFTAGLNLNIFTLLTIDRFLAIRRPFWYINHIQNSTVIKTMFACFVFQSLLISCMAATFRYDYSDKDLFTRCDYAKNFPPWIRKCAMVLVLSKLIICLFCTTIVAVTVWKKLTALKNISRDEYVKKVASAKITIILMFIYFCLYSPSLLLLTARSLSHSTRAIIYVIVDHLRYTNCWVNAIIYAFTRKAYKKAYKHILTHWPNEWSGVAYELRVASQLVSSTNEKELSAKDAGSNKKDKSRSSTDGPIDEKTFSKMNTEAISTKPSPGSDEEISWITSICNLFSKG